MTLVGRFQAAGIERLVDALAEQHVLCGNRDIAREIAEAATLQGVARGDVLVRQDGTENEIFFVVSGVFRIVVNGRDVATRTARDLIGEMSAVDAAAPRSASVVAASDGLVARIDEPTFTRLADKYPFVWRMIARVLCRRLDERRRFHIAPNDKPVVFVGSSLESKAIAEAFAGGIPASTALARLWTHDVFRASSFPIDDLDAQLQRCDFAVLVAAADDRVTSRGATSDAPRDNVIFELGLFMGAISRPRTFLLEPRGAAVKLPSDLKGINTLRFDPTEPDLSKAVAAAVSELVTIIGAQGPR